MRAVALSLLLGSSIVIAFNEDQHFNNFGQAAGDFFRGAANEFEQLGQRAENPFLGGNGGGPPHHGGGPERQPGNGNNNHQPGNGGQERGQGNDGRMGGFGQDRRFEGGHEERNGGRFEERGGGHERGGEDRRHDDGRRGFEPMNMEERREEEHGGGGEDHGGNHGGPGGHGGGRHHHRDNAHAFHDLFNIGRGFKLPSLADWGDHASSFCDMFPHHHKCKNGGKPLFTDLAEMTKAMERRQRRRHVPRIFKKDWLAGVPTFLRDHVHRRKQFWQLADDVRQKFRNHCHGRVNCLEQPQDAVTRRKLLRDSITNIHIVNFGKKDEDADDDVEVQFDRVHRIKKALLEKANLTKEVVPADDGVFDSDLLLTEEQSNIILNDLGKAETTGDEGIADDNSTVPVPPTDSRKKRAGLYFEEKFAEKWDLSQPIPYVIDGSVPSYDATDIRDGVAAISKVTCIRFQELRAKPASGYYINYVRIDSPTFCGLSYIGRVKPVNTVYLSFQCGKNKGIVVHETMHALGVIHQHIRMDRDQHIKVDWDNVNPQYYDQLAVADQSIFTSYGVKYAYNSIMHYNAFTNAIDTKKPTMIPLVNSQANLAILGQRDQLSPEDISLLNKMYCKAASCTDSNIYCGAWALDGVCTLQGNSVWMASNCRKSCNLC